MHTKGLVSIIIPSRNENFLYKTVKGLLETATGNIEIIVVLEGYWPPVEELVLDPRVNYIHKGEAQGMREAINSAAAIAKGEYLLKSDAHCKYDGGFDEKLKASHFEDNWIQIPRRKRLDAELWEVQDVDKVDVDYEFLGSPAYEGAKGSIWTERIIERLNDPQYDLDENMSFQGSCWFMTKEHYWTRLNGMQVEGYGSFVREAQELGLKTWLGGGRIMTNKMTWYAHLHKGKKYGRGYYLDKRAMIRGEEYCDAYWFGNKYPNAVYDLAWLIERFGGTKVPTWTDELIEQVRKK